MEGGLLSALELPTPHGKMPARELEKKRALQVLNRRQWEEPARETEEKRQPEVASPGKRNALERPSNACQRHCHSPLKRGVGGIAG